MTSLTLGDLRNPPLRQAAAAEQFDTTGENVKFLRRAVITRVAGAFN